MAGCAPNTKTPAFLRAFIVLVSRSRLAVAHRPRTIAADFELDFTILFGNAVDCGRTGNRAISEHRSSGIDANARARVSADLAANGNTVVFVMMSFSLQSAGCSGSLPHQRKSAHVHKLILPWSYFYCNETHCPVTIHVSTGPVCWLDDAGTHLGETIGIHRRGRHAMTLDAVLRRRMKGGVERRPSLPAPSMTARERPDQVSGNVAACLATRWRLVRVQPPFESAVPTHLTGRLAPVCCAPMDDAFAGSECGRLA